MIYFDSHIHLGNLPIMLNEETKDLLAYKEYSKNTPENCIKKALANSVSKAVIFPFPIIEQDFALQNKIILDACQKYPYFFVPFLLPESACELEKKQNSFVGIKDHFYFDFHNQIQRSEVLEFAQSCGKYYIFHAHSKRWGERLSYICKNFPKLQVIIAHSARPAPFLGTNIQNRIAEFNEIIPKKLLDNFYFETSTIRDCNAIKAIVSTYGEEHVLWGTDFPYYSNKGENVFSMEQSVITESPISDNAKEIIFSGNFRRLFQNNQVWIRHATKHDSSALLKMLGEISAQEKKYLALSLKMSLVKTQIRKGSHILIAESPSNEILGFIRVSDRRNNSVMIEEVYVLPKARGEKIATKMVTSVCPAYSSAEVKTYATNVGMNTTLERLGFKATYSPKKTMIVWTKS